MNYNNSLKIRRSGGSKKKRTVAKTKVGVLPRKPRIKAPNTEEKRSRTRPLRPRRPRPRPRPRPRRRPMKWSKRR